ncbi:MAG: hypothetical protein OXB95_05515 [Rhodobacteraceae bacterium]|nr:hypothetical protein [Paracoccaceae bacterium]
MNRNKAHLSIPMKAGNAGKQGWRPTFTHAHSQVNRRHPPSVHHMALNPDQAGFIDASLDNQGSTRAINNPNKL